MKHKFYSILLAGAVFFLPIASGAQNLGSAAGFVLFTGNGAVVNTGITHLTGHVGTNSGSSTGFGNVNGIMHNNNGVTGTASSDLLTCYNSLNSAVATMFPSPLMGNGQSLNAGIYSISGNTTLNNTLTLNGQNNANAVFIIKIQGTFSSASNAKVILINGALACNVFWKVEGLVSLASGTTMRGNIVANNAAIDIASGVILEGRALSTTGALSVNNITAYTPAGCGSAVLTGPASPTLGASECFALFSSDGPVSNSGNTFANGDIGTDVGLTTGFNPLNITGTVHPIPDNVTDASAADLLIAYTYLNALTSDIELLYPAQFGNDLVLTPHVYVLNGATMFVDTLILNAQGVPNAVFVIQINGALTTGTYAKVKLINGTQAKYVFWKVEGAVDIDDYSEFVGTIICNNGAVDLGTGVKLDGRAHTTTGALAVTAVTVTMPTSCTTSTTLVAPSITGQPGSKTVCIQGTAIFTVSATGTSLTYQWRKGTVNLANAGNISGVTTRTLTISPAALVDASGNYNVVVSGAAAPSATSSLAALVVEDCTPTGVVGLNAQRGIAVYPNPSAGTVSIFVPGTSVAEPAVLTMHSILGVQILRQDLTAELTNLSKEFATGVYIYTVENSKGTISSRLIVK